MGQALIKYKNPDFGGFELKHGLYPHDKPKVEIQSNLCFYVFTDKNVAFVDSYNQDWNEVVLLTSVTSTQQSLDISEIEEFYKMESRSEVASYVNKNPFLKNILKKAIPRIKETFPKSIVSLKMVCDPEDVELDHIAAYINVGDEDPEKVFDKYQAMKKAWMTKFVSEAKGKFLIDLEFA